MRNIEIFKKWMIYQASDIPGMRIKEKNHTLYLSYKEKLALIKISTNNVIEESVHDRYGDGLFYLYYDFEHYSLAVSFFQAMLRVLIREENLFYHKILLCCSGGMTTSYFKLKMNKYLRLAHAPYYVEASALSDMGMIAHLYDAVFVAPQMTFAINRLKKEFPDKKIVPIDSEIFASYDCGKLYTLFTELFD